MQTPGLEAASVQVLLEQQLEQKAQQFKTQVQSTLIKAGLDHALAPLVQVDLKRNGAAIILTVDTTLLYTSTTVPGAISLGLDNWLKSPNPADAAYTHQIPAKISRPQVLALQSHLARDDKDWGAQQNVVTQKLSEFAAALNSPQTYSQKMMVDFDRPKQAFVEGAFNSVFAAGQNSQR